MARKRKRKRKLTKKCPYAHGKRIRIRHRHKRPIKNTHRAPRTLKQFLAMPEKQQDRWSRVPQVISRMRDEGTSLRKASREFGISAGTVLRFGKSALRRKKGRFVAKPTDTLLRILVVPTKEGKRELAVYGSRQASLLGEYWAAVHKYVSTGDSSAIEKFKDKHITDAGRKRIPLLTYLEEIDRQASAGELSFESLYV